MSHVDHRNTPIDTISSICLMFIYLENFSRALNIWRKRKRHTQTEIRERQTDDPSCFLLGTHHFRWNDRRHLEHMFKVNQVSTGITKQQHAFSTTDIKIFKWNEILCTLITAVEHNVVESRVVSWPLWCLYSCCEATDPHSSAGVTPATPFTPGRAQTNKATLFKHLIHTKTC